MRNWLVRSVLVGIASGAVLASQNLAFIFMGYALYLIHGIAYVAFFQPLNPLFHSDDVLYIDRPLFAEGGFFPLFIVVLATLICVAAWAWIVSFVAGPRVRRLHLVLQCLLGVFAFWAVPAFIRFEPDSLVAPLGDDIAGLIWVLLPYAVLAGVIGHGVGGYRGLVLLPAIGSALLLLAILTPPLAWLADLSFSATHVIRLVGQYAGDSAPPILQTLYNHYWRAAKWTYVITLWSIFVSGAACHLRRVHQGSVEFAKALAGSGPVGS